MKLYFSPGTCSLAPHIVLRESRLPAELQRVDLRTHQTASGGTTTGSNPKGSVPLLETDEGMRLTEGPIIAQYIATRPVTPSSCHRPERMLVIA